jgi:cation-dependent mannose-6-phosphate receptor
LPVLTRSLRYCFFTATNTQQAAMADDKPADKPCTITLEDGTFYDLNQLSTPKADYEADAGDAQGNLVYKLNVCRGVVSEPWNIDDASTVGGFINGRGHSDFSLG